jgi:hypothetical protein
MSDVDAIEPKLESPPTPPIQPNPHPVSTHNPEPPADPVEVKLSKKQKKKLRAQLDKQAKSTGGDGNKDAQMDSVSSRAQQSDELLSNKPVVPSMAKAAVRIRARHSIRHQRAESFYRLLHRLLFENSSVQSSPRRWKQLFGL